MPQANWDFIKKPCTWLFDLDDTLAWNCVCYNRPILDFIGYIAIIFANRVPSPGTIIRLQEDIDCELGKELNPLTGKFYGFSKERFPEAFARTYKELCAMGFGEYRSDVADTCRSIGRKAFDRENYRKIGLVPNAASLLTDLRDRGDRLAIVTKGDHDVQNAKISEHGLRSMVDEVYIVDYKEGMTYVDILVDLCKNKVRRSLPYDPTQTVVVGNSFASDIVPALKSGMYGIFIPCPTWKAECMDTSKIDEDERARVREVKEIVDIFGML